MQVIINADDFGHDSDTVESTIECFRRGMLTSATIMPNMPATMEAVTFARKHPRCSFGVHLTYTCHTVERPLCNPRSLPSLTTRSGTFLSPNTMRVASLCGRLTVADIARETTEQLAFIRDQGLHISHVDSHGHLHKFGAFQAALREVLPRFGIRKVRAVQNIYFHSPFRRPTFWLGAVWRSRLRRNFCTTDFMYMPDGAADEGWYESISSRLTRNGSLEVGVHPGHVEGWRRRQTFELEQFVLRCRRAEVQFINWNDIAVQ